MTAVALIYPALAMFALTLGVLVALGVGRVRAIRRREVKLSHFRTYTEGSPPPRLQALTRHAHNHFEVPPLFYIGVLLTCVANAVTLTGVVFAWLFVAARCVHTVVHLGHNDVRHRFYVFAASLAFLAGLWLTLLHALLTAGA